MFSSALASVKEQSPLVDCITNMVTVESMANALLAIGAAPCMADVPEEILEFVAVSDAVLCNIGGMSDQNVEAMRLAAPAASEQGKSLVLDPVGLGVSKRRHELCQTLLAHAHFTAIRGNISELRALAGMAGATRGVDADAADAMETEAAADLATDLAQRYQTVICLSGAVDVIADGRQTARLYGGDPMMARITGSGCMSGAILAAFLAAEPNDPFTAALTATALVKAAGGYAAAKTRQTGRGMGSFHTYFMDGLSLLRNEDIKRLVQINQR